MTVPFAACHLMESGVVPPNACGMKLRGTRTMKAFLIGRAVTFNGGAGFAPPDWAGKCSVTEATPSGTTPLRPARPDRKPTWLIAPRCSTVVVVALRVQARAARSAGGERHDRDPLGVLDGGPALG